MNWNRDFWFSANKFVLFKFPIQETFQWKKYEFFFSQMLLFMFNLVAGFFSYIFSYEVTMAKTQVARNTFNIHSFIVLPKIAMNFYRIYKFWRRNSEILSIFNLFIGFYLLPYLHLYTIKILDVTWYKNSRKNSWNRLDPLTLRFYLFDLWHTQK